MAIKRIIGKTNKKYRKCMRCDKQTSQVLRDNTVYTCEYCGQQHFVDVYPKNIALTVVEYPGMRKRRKGYSVPAQQSTREALVDKVEARRRELDEWEEQQKDWLEKLAAMKPRQLTKELNCMDDELRQRVKNYLEKRKISR